MINRIRRILMHTAWIMLAAAMIGHFALDQKYVSSPRHPEPDSGRIAPYEISGTTVFITEPQRNILRLLVIVQILSAIAFVGGFVTLKIWPDSGKDKSR